MKRTAGLLLLFSLLGVSDIAAQDVSNVDISGTKNVGQSLTGTYTGDMGATGDHYEYRWYTSPPRTALSSTTVNYTLTASESGKGIYFKVLLLDASDAVLDSDSSIVYNVNTLPVATFPVVVGEARPGLTLFASYVYSDAEGNTESGSTFQWYTAGNSSGTGATPINPATSSSYKLKDTDKGDYIGFTVTPAALTGSSPGAQVTTSVFKFVETNDEPSAGTVTITGGSNVNDVLTGHYNYSDYEGDLESGSTYEWSRSLNSGGPFNDVITTSTGITHQIRMEDQRMYFRLSVTPGSATGTTPGTKQTSVSTAQKVNSKPYVTGVYISGNDSVGQVVTGKFTFHDDDGDAHGTHLYQWFRDGNAIVNATNSTYTLTVFDFSKQITFKVTPVSATGFPNTGDQVASSAIGPVEDPLSPPPTADEICISGKRQTGQQLTGNYHYVNGYPEEDSEKIWFRDKTKIKSSTTSNKYTLVTADIGREIRFAVVPRNDSGEKGDTVFSDPLAIFNLSRSIYSDTDSPQLLQALPMGGIFSGSNVSDGYFNPKVAGEGSYNLTYVYTIDNDFTNCSQTAYATVEVLPNVVEFFSVKPVYCDGNGNDTVYVRNVPALATAKLFSISNPSANLTILTDTSVIFNPDPMSSGEKVDYIKYTYFVGLAFYELVQELVIEHIGAVSINLTNGFQKCSNDAPVELFPSLSGGTFTGPVIGNKLDPSLVPGGYGDVIVSYTYESSKGCKSTVVVPGRVNPLADISFTPADFCILDDNDSTKMVNNTNELDPVNSWLWEFSEGGVTLTNTKEEPSFLYRLGGFYKIVLTATTVNDCVSKKEETFDIGRKPKAVLKWENECYREGESILFIDKSISTSLIQERRWKFFDAVELVNNESSMLYPMMSAGPMPVRFIVSNGYEGCEDTVKINVNIRPTVVLKDLTDKIYDEKFTSGNGGWVPDYDTLNKWKFGTPDRTTIKGAFSGTNAWYTGYEVLNQKNGESSSIVSPCFDFTDIDRPMIKMQLWKDFDRDRDGAVLQYRIGDSEIWEPVGSLEDGIRWFNSTLIKGRPGGDQIGWTSKGVAETGYSEASHKLDFLKDSVDVKFRIAYGSNGTSLDNDGIAFDDIWIGSRTRQVLVEHFTNSSQTLSRTSNEMVNEIASASQKDLINIQYHTNFSPDLYYNDNPGETGARILYYGLIRSPYTFLDGGTRLRYASTYDYNLADIDSNEVNRRSMVTPDFKIMLDADTSGGVLSVNGTVSALNDIQMENMTLYIAVTEKESDTHPGTNGETVFYNVFRKFLPDAGGVSLKKTWLKGDNVTIPSQSWVVSNIAEDSDIEVIAFLQNNITKELYQAGSVKFTDIAVGIEDLLQESGSEFILYPNPVVNKLTVAFRDPLRGETDINIYDIRGVLVKSFKAGAGESQISTDDLNLRNGVYLLKVFNGRSLKGVKKLVVTGN